MEANHKPNRLHPLVATAAVAVTVLSITGVAAITGLLPASHGESGPGSASVAHMFAPVPAATGEAAANFTTPVEPKVQPAADAAEKPVPQATYKPASSERQSERQGTRAASSAYRQQTTQVAQARATCNQCGRVEAVTPVKEEGQASGVGIVAGAVLGGVLGNQVGGGNGKKLATVAGAVGGGYAGNEVEKRARATSSYQVRVRMENGTSRTFRETTDNWSVGDRVRIVNGELTMRG